MRHHQYRRLIALEKRPNPAVLGPQLAALMRRMDEACAVPLESDEHYATIGREIAERARRLALENA